MPPYNQPFYALRESETVQLDGSGNGTITIGPSKAGNIWYPKNVHVICDSNNNEATVLIYAGAPTFSNYRDTGFVGSSGDATDALQADEITTRNKITAVFTGGDPGANAYVNVSGMQRT